MQPYFFPYLGYWQMLNAVDKFVILDDVNYIKRGYINSNSILINGKAHKFTISIEKPSQNKLINETKLFFPKEERERLLRTVDNAYKKADCYSAFFSVFKSIVLYDSSDLTEYLKNSLIEVSKYLDVRTEILLSSEIEKNNSLKAEERIIEINKCLGSDVYINAIGGQALYDAKHFRDVGIDLKFIKMGDVKYRQYNNEFVPNLSFIDVLMFNGINSTKQLLEQYELI
ncbi:MAG: WbqC family protein [Butyrivibrio sp.]|nr:WbqC family protein [Butyrivibrio sp.]